MNQQYASTIIRVDFSVNSIKIKFDKLDYDSAMHVRVQMASPSESFSPQQSKFPHSNRKEEDNTKKNWIFK